MAELQLVPESAMVSTERQFLRMLMLGSPRVGKSFAALSTAPRPIYWINSDGRGALDGAIETMLEKKIKPDFQSNVIQSAAKMEEAIKLARSLVKEKGVKTIGWDTMSSFSDYLLDECVNASAAASSSGKSDGRKYWPEYHKRMQNIVQRLFKIDAHVVICSHWIDTSSESDDNGDKKTPKIGKGIIPLLGGASRLTIPRHFADIVFVEKRKSAEDRVFLCDIDGVWGPGCRSLPGVSEVKADIGLFLRMKDERMKKLLAAMKGSASR